MRTPLRTLAVLALAATIMTGCRSGSAEHANNDSTTNGSAASGSSAATTKASSARDKAVQFAECMRGNGVPEFPDPDASGQFKFGIGDAVAFDKALNACKDLEPAGFFGDNSSALEMSKRLVFAKCMRENGVTDFPDPIKGGALVDTNRIPSMANKSVKDDKPFNDAATKCFKVYEAAGGGK